MKRALTQLGFGPVYHMSELLGIDAARQPSPMEMLGLGSGHCDAWTEVERRISGSAIGGSGSASVSAGSPAPAGKVLGKDAFDFLKGQENDRDDISYVSALDLPVAAYFPELLATTSFGNPKTKAKVILTTREPHEWWRSSRDSWCRLIGAGPGAAALDRAAAFMYSLRPYGTGVSFGCTLRWDELRNGFCWEVVAQVQMGTPPGISRLMGRFPGLACARTKPSR